MAARDHYNYDIKCPSCGQDGNLAISEADHPYMSNPDRVVKRVTGNFEADTPDGVKVIATCKKCNHTFAT